jgi:hypothetical protein
MISTIATGQANGMTWEQQWKPSPNCSTTVPPILVLLSATLPATWLYMTKVTSPTLLLPRLDLAMLTISSLVPIPVTHPNLRPLTPPPLVNGAIDVLCQILCVKLSPALYASAAGLARILDTESILGDEACVFSPHFLLISPLLSPHLASDGSRPFSLSFCEWLKEKRKYFVPSLLFMLGNSCIPERLVTRSVGDEKLTTPKGICL